MSLLSSRMHSGHTAHLISLIPHAQPDGSRYLVSSFTVISFARSTFPHKSHSAIHVCLSIRRIPQFFQETFDFVFCKVCKTVTSAVLFIVGSDYHECCPKQCSNLVCYFVYSHVHTFFLSAQRISLLVATVTFSTAQAMRKRGHCELKRLSLQSLR